MSPASAGPLRSASSRAGSPTRRTASNRLRPRFVLRASLRHAIPAPTRRARGTRQARFAAGFPVPQVHGLCEDSSSSAALFVWDGRCRSSGQRLPGLPPGERAAHLTRDATIAQLHSSILRRSAGDYGSPPPSRAAVGAVKAVSRRPDAGRRADGRVVAGWASICPPTAATRGPSMGSLRHMSSTIPTAHRRGARREFRRSAIRLPLRLSLPETACRRHLHRSCRLYLAAGIPSERLSPLCRAPARDPSRPASDGVVMFRLPAS